MTDGPGKPGLASAAGLIAALTTASRLVGFARIFVFTSLLGIAELGHVYQSINLLPNIAFEIVAGGALAMVVVPLLSGALARGEAADVSATSSALVTWTVAVLTPIALGVAAFAHPIAGWLLTEHVDFGARLLIAFAPQLVLYGVGIVLTGVLQAHRRFAGPALAPLLSSVTVIGAYVVLWALAGRRPAIEALSHGEELVLGVGTTAGVAVLSLCLLVPLRATGVRLRPTFAFPPGVARQLRGLIGGGVLAVVGQQLALLAALKLSQVVEGFQLYGLAQTMFLLPWAVLAVPVATSAFPRLAEAHARGDDAGFARTLAASARSVLLLTAVAAAALFAAAEPVARVIVSTTGQDVRGPGSATLAHAIAAFAPGLLGYGLLALLGRALYAARAGRAAAAATVGGWAVVIGASYALAAALPQADRVVALAAANSIGMTVLGLGLVVLVRRRVGMVPGLVRACGAAVALLVAGAAAGLGARRVLDLGLGIGGSLAQGMLVGVVVAITSGVVALAAYPHALTKLKGTARD